MSVLVKICGLKTSEAVEAALAAGADLVGFVFFPPSPRHLGFEGARLLSEQVGNRAQKVVVTVDANNELLAAAIAAVSPDLLQLHGKEAPERVSTIRSRFKL